GARLLPRLPERQARLRQGLVEHRQLGRRRSTLRPCRGADQGPPPRLIGPSRAESDGAQIPRIRDPGAVILSGARRQSTGTAGRASVEWEAERLPAIVAGR